MEAEDGATARTDETGWGRPCIGVRGRICGTGLSPASTSWIGKTAAVAANDRDLFEACGELAVLLFEGFDARPRRCEIALELSIFPLILCRLVGIRRFGGERGDAWPVPARTRGQTTGQGRCPCMRHQGTRGGWRRTRLRPGGCWSPDPPPPGRKGSGRPGGTAHRDAARIMSRLSSATSAASRSLRRGGVDGVPRISTRSKARPAANATANVSSTASGRDVGLRGPDREVCYLGSHRSCSFRWVWRFSG